MPLFSDLSSLSLYYGGSINSYSSPYLGVGNNYSNHSSIGGGYSRTPLPSYSGIRSYVPSRPYAPILSTISENSSSRRGILARLSPEVQSRLSPKYKAPKPISINTSDIDVSYNKYSKSGIKSTAAGAPTQSSVNESATDQDGFEPGRNTIRRGRSVIRLHTIRRKSPKSDKSTEEQRSEMSPPPETDTMSPILSPTKQSPRKWRENLSEDLNFKDKRAKKTPGEKLMEKFLIRDNKEEEEALSLKELREKRRLENLANYSDGNMADYSDNNMATPTAIKRHNSSKRHSTRKLQSFNDARNILLKNQSEESEQCEELDQNNVGEELPPKINRKSLRKSMSSAQNQDSNLLKHRRFSQELLEEQASIFDALIRDENLSNTQLDLSKVGLEESDPAKSLKINRTGSKRKKKSTNTLDEDSGMPQSDNAINETGDINRAKSPGPMLPKVQKIRKSSSGGMINVMDAITENPQEPVTTKLNAIVESGESHVQHSVPKTKPKITSTVEVKNIPATLKAKVEEIVVDKIAKPKPSLLSNLKYDVVLEDDMKKINEHNQTKPMKKSFFNEPKNKTEPIDVKVNLKKKQSMKRGDSEDVPDFWQTIGKRETVYYKDRKKRISTEVEQQRKAYFSPEDEFCIEEESPLIEESKIEPVAILPATKIIDDTVTQITSLEPIVDINANIITTEDAKKTSEDFPTTVENLKSPKIDEPKSVDLSKENTTKIESPVTEAETPKVEVIAKPEIAPEQSKVTPIQTIEPEVPKTIEDSTQSQEAKLILEAKPTELPKIVEAKESTPKLETKEPEKPKMVEVKESTPKLQTKEAEKPKIVEVKESIPKLEAKEAEKPKMVEVKESTPKLETKETEKPKIVEVKESTPKLETKEAEKPKMVEVKESTPKLETKEAEKPKISAPVQPKAVEDVKLTKTNEIKGPVKKPEVKSDLQNKTAAPKSDTPAKAKDIPKVDPVKKIVEKSKSPPVVDKEKSEVGPKSKVIPQKRTTPVKAKKPEVETKQIDVVEPKIEEVKTEENKITSEPEKVEEPEIKADEVKKEDEPVKEIVEEATKVEIKEEVQEAPKVEIKVPDPLPKPVIRKPVKEEAPLRPLIATPKPLQKRQPQLQSDSEESSEEESSEEEETESSESSEEDEFYECETKNTKNGDKDVRTSTSSNDSGFDSSAPTSPSGIACIKKDCDVNCHKKCEKLAANLCGVNQKLIVEALASVKKNEKPDTHTRSGDGREGATASGAPPSDSLNCDAIFEASTAYTAFQRSGRVTPPATTIPRFRKYTVEDFFFLKVLGKGSFGKVLLAELRNTEYYYAIKCLKKDIVLEDDDVECTLIERKVLALGTKHPYLCHLFCTFQTESHLFFVMEYLNGGDLMFHIQQSGRFQEPRARFYAAEIVSGLKFLHKKGIVYRDLKLDNILLDYEGHVRIADFGMCKLQIYLDRTADTFCGTPDYMAPEIIKGLKYNQTVDWWSFGVLLYEMLIGQSPFSGCDEDELFWSICNELPSYPRFLSREALQILNMLLDKDSNTRLGGVECVNGDICDQDFFRPIHWDKLERRQLETPFTPQVRHPLDTQYFDKAFTGERARLTPVEGNILRSMDHTQFRGFSYTNPNATDH